MNTLMLKEGVLIKTINANNNDLIMEELKGYIYIKVLNKMKGRN